jgi:hypothetical protein
MENSTIEIVVKVCELLNKHGVEYLIVGGTAVALHGHHRGSLKPSGELAEKPDLDIWYNPSYQNYFRVLNVLNDLDVDVSNLKQEKTPNPKKSYFRKEFDGFTLDLLPELPGLSRFLTSYDKRVEPKIGELKLPTLSYEDLMLNKKSLGRAKDIEDIKQLQKKRRGLKK